MRLRSICLLIVLALAGVKSATADVRWTPIRFYDPLFSLPREAESYTTKIGIFNTGIGDWEDGRIITTYQYGLTDSIEIGTTIVSNPLLGISNDVLSSIDVGGKLLIGSKQALTLSCYLPLGGVGVPGLSLGYMKAISTSSVDINMHTQIGTLDAYAEIIRLQFRLGSRWDLEEGLFSYVGIVGSIEPHKLEEEAIWIDSGCSFKVRDRLLLRGSFQLGVSGQVNDFQLVLSVAMRSNGY
jgi:hypothetical protein